MTRGSDIRGRTTPPREDGLACQEDEASGTGVPIRAATSCGPSGTAALRRPGYRGRSGGRPDRTAPAAGRGPVNSCRGLAWPGAACSSVHPALCWARAHAGACWVPVRRSTYGTRRPVRARSRSCPPGDVSRSGAVCFAVGGCSGPTRRGRPKGLWSVVAQRLDELGLGHRGPAPYPDLAGPLDEIVLAPVIVGGALTALLPDRGA